MGGDTGHARNYSRDARFARTSKRDYRCHCKESEWERGCYSDHVAWTKDTVAPGTTRSSHECWSKPELDLKSESRPPDNSRNKDARETPRLHVVRSRSGLEYGGTDRRLCSFATPQDVSRVDGQRCRPQTGVSPPPHRLAADVHEAVRAVGVMIGATGAVVRVASRWWLRAAFCGTGLCARVALEQR